MILGPEAILAVSLFTAPRRRTELDMHCFISGTQNSFDLFSGMSLERKVKIDLEEISGVRDVDVQRIGSDVTVTVVVAELEFGSFEKITRQEMDLSDAHPELSFDFSVVPEAVLKDAA